MINWKGLSNVLHGVHHLKIQIQRLDDSIVHLNQVVLIHIFPLLIANKIFLIRLECCVVLSKECRLR